MDDEIFNKLKGILKEIDVNSLNEYLSEKTNIELDDAIIFSHVLVNSIGGVKTGLLPLSKVFIEFINNNSLINNEKVTERIKVLSEDIEKNSAKINELNEELQTIDKNFNHILSQISKKESIENQLKFKRSNYNDQIQHLEEINNSIEELKHILNNNKPIQKAASIPPELLEPDKLQYLSNYMEYLGTCYVEIKMFPKTIGINDAEPNCENIIHEYLLLKNFLKEKKLYVNELEINALKTEYESIINEMESVSQHAKEFFKNFTQSSDIKMKKE